MLFVFAIRCQWALLTNPDTIRNAFRTLSNIYNGAFCKNGERPSTIKKLRLKCLTRFWINLGLLWRNNCTEKKDVLLGLILQFFIFNIGTFIYHVRKIFWKTNISYLLISKHTCVYQGVRNASFFGKFSVRTKWMVPIDQGSFIINYSRC